MYKSWLTHILTANKILSNETENMEYKVRCATAVFIPIYMGRCNMYNEEVGSIRMPIERKSI